MVKPRPARPTVKCVDTYCELYKDLFVEVRAYEYFKYLHVGLISELKRKSLPAIASSVGIDNEQGLLHFLTESPWKAEDLEKRRLEIILNVLQGRESHSNFISVIEKLGIEYAVAIRSNHGVWLPSSAKVRANKWKEFEHIRSRRSDRSSIH